MLGIQNGVGPNARQVPYLPPIVSIWPQGNLRSLNSKLKEKPIFKNLKQTHNGPSNSDHSNNKKKKPVTHQNNKTLNTTFVLL